MAPVQAPVVPAQNIQTEGTLLRFKSDVSSLLPKHPERGPHILRQGIISQKILETLAESVRINLKGMGLKKNHLCMKIAELELSVRNTKDKGWQSTSKQIRRS